MINYDDFKKVDLRIAKVIEAEKVEDSNKLIKLQVDLGEDEKRQIVAGIGKAYDAESLIGKEIIIVANLEPRTLLGLESNGMILAVRDEDGLPVLVLPEKEVEPGSEVG